MPPAVALKVRSDEHDAELSAGNRALLAAFLVVAAFVVLLAVLV